MNRLNFLLVCLLVISCNKSFEVPCPTEDEDLGLIIESILDESASCWNQSLRASDVQEGVVIQNEIEFENAISQMDIIAELCVLPSIDFSTKTVLGLSTKGTGCTRTYRKSVQATTDGFEYEVTVRECGGCEPLELVNHWVVVPKIAPGTKIVFSVKTQKFNS